jgi:hypothetical protein
MHPTYDEALDMINSLLRRKICRTCTGKPGWICDECLVYIVREKYEDSCSSPSNSAKLLGMAFLLTMPENIKRSLK